MKEGVPQRPRKAVDVPQTWAPVSACRPSDWAVFFVRRVPPLGEGLDARSKQGATSMLDLDALVRILAAAKLALELRELLRKDRSDERRGDTDDDVR